MRTILEVNYAFIDCFQIAFDIVGLKVARGEVLESDMS